MTPKPTGAVLDPRRATLASFANAYAVAVQRRENTGIDQFIVRTGNPLQPVRITEQRPANSTDTLALVA